MLEALYTAPAELEVGRQGLLGVVITVIKVEPVGPRHIQGSITAMTIRDTQAPLEVMGEQVVCMQEEEEEMVGMGEGEDRVIVEEVVAPRTPPPPLVSLPTPKELTTRN
jgi:hypothetical protein